jgi:hypothetical protein
MIDQSGTQDACNDRERSLETSRENEGEKLGFVADFRESDNACRNDQGFHDWFQGRTKTMTTHLPGQCGGCAVKGLAKLRNRSRHDPQVKHVDASPFT